MPPEYNHPSLAGKKTKYNRDGEEDHVRRQRGELACSECSRLKLKCDKKVPCSSCIRRCCSDICPNGRSNKQPASRIPPAITERLNDKIRELTHRVRQLEDALAVLQAVISDEPHPLLNTQHQIQPVQALKTTQDQMEEFENNLGSLTIQNKGETFLGPTAGSETLFLYGPSISVSNTSSPSNGDTEDQEAGSPPAGTVPNELLLLSEVFPFLPGGKWNDIRTVYSILDFLPDRNRAWSLCETYFHQGSWGQRAVLRDEAIDELLTPLYDHMRTVDWSSPAPVPLTPHQISTLFSIFSLGAYVDLTLPVDNQEAELYHKLAVCAFTLHSFYSSPELATVQAACLLSSYLSLSVQDDRHGTDLSWRCLSFACDVAHTIGLHRDPGRWGFNPKIAEKRRNVFWELYTAELYFSTATGRPPHFRQAFIDCDLPTEPQDSLQENRDVSGTFWYWKHRFSVEVNSLINELTLKTKAPSYEAILSLDAKLKDFPLPPMDQLNLDPENPNNRQRSYATHVILSHYKARATLYLHKSFFVKAMLENPSDPLKSKYATSFLSSFRAASEVIKITKQVYTWTPDLMRRWWQLFVQLFSAALVVGSVAIRAPSPAMTRLAFDNLKIAVDLAAAMGGSRGRHGRYAQAILERILAKATTVYNQILTGSPNPGCYQDPFDDAELRIFGGHTVVSQIESGRVPALRQSLTPSVSDNGNIQGEQRTNDNPGLSNAVWPPDQDPTTVAFMDPSQPTIASSEGWADSTTSSSLYTHDPAAVVETTSTLVNADVSTGQIPYEAASHLGQAVHEYIPSTAESGHSNDTYNHYTNDNSAFAYDNTPWAELIAPLDPNFSATHTDEAKMIDEYWTSFMRDAGVLNNFPTF